MINKILATLGLLGILTLSGCDSYRSERSPVLHEDARVAAKIHSPSRHNTDIGFTAIKLGGSFGMDYGGNFGLRIGNGMQLSSTSIPEKYGILFECQHGNFTSQGSDERHKNLYNRLQTNDIVDVTYRELYEVHYSDVNNDGKQEVVERKMYAMDFLDAQVKTNKQNQETN
jgi:hypothetical protein